MEEIWKDVINGKYMLSKSGVLVNKKSMKVRKGNLDKGGYVLDSFRIDGKIIAKARHRLMWETFVGEIPEGYEINHKDENKQNNILSNLNLLTHKANMNFGTRNERAGKALSKSVVQKSLDGEVIKIWSSTIEIERQLGYRHGNICECCNGKRKSAYGFIWQYTEEKATA